MKTRFLTVALAAATVAALGLGVSAGPVDVAALPGLTNYLGGPDGLVGIGLGGLIINQANLNRIYTGFKTSFMQGLGMAPSQWERVATTVPSSTREEKYGWLGKVPGVRKWIGDRVLQNIMLHDYSIKNEPFDLTIGVNRDDIEDDQVGVYAPLFREMGNSIGAHPNQLVFELLKDGFTTLADDGQNFFDTDHPVLDENGAETSVANTDGGAATPWFLMDTRRALKPAIYQHRKSFNLVSLTAEDDENVFMRKEFLYGVDGRSNGVVAGPLPHPVPYPEGVKWADAGR